MQYAHESNQQPRTLPAQWTNPATGDTIMGLSLLSDTELAALGWYPVRREPLEPGASGYAPIELIDNEFVIASLPGDPEQHLATTKSAKYQERIDALLAARNAGFQFNGKKVDSDQDSRILISGAVQLATLAMMTGTPEALAQFSASLGAGWRYSDGTIAATDAAGMIALGQALAIHIATCDAVSQMHKASIEACTTAAECAALDVTTGYPS
jgi:hypothetical protein